MIKDTGIVDWCFMLVDCRCRKETDGGAAFLSTVVVTSRHSRGGKRLQ